MLSVTASSSFPCNATFSHSKILKHTVVVIFSVLIRNVSFYLNDLKTFFYFAVAWLQAHASAPVRYHWSASPVGILLVCVSMVSHNFHGELLPRKSDEWQIERSRDYLRLEIMEDVADGCVSHLVVQGLSLIVVISISSQQLP